MPVPPRKPVPNRYSSYGASDLNSTPPSYSPPPRPAFQAYHQQPLPAAVPSQYNYTQQYSHPGAFQPFSQQNRVNSTPTAASEGYFPPAYSHDAGPGAFPATPDSGYAGTPAGFSPPPPTKSWPSIAPGTGNPDTLGPPPGTPQRQRPVSGQYYRSAYSPGPHGQGFGRGEEGLNWHRRSLSGQFPDPIAAGSPEGRFQESPGGPLMVGVVGNGGPYNEHSPPPPPPPPPPTQSGEFVLPLRPQREGLGGLEGKEDDARSDFSFQEDGERGFKPNVVVTGEPVNGVAAQNGEDGNEPVGEQEDEKEGGAEEGEGEGDGVEDDEGDLASESGFSDQLIPFEFRKWRPFKEFDWEDITQEEFDRINTLGEKLFHEKRWKKKAEIAIEIMRPILDYGEEEYAIGRLVEGEVRRIFGEAEKFPHERDFLPTRYIRNPDLDVKEGTGKTAKNDHDDQPDEEEEEPQYPELCDHDDNCACWYETSPDAGIPGFPVKSRYRRAVLEFIHNFIAELLMRLTEWANMKDDECLAGGEWEFEMMMEDQLKVVEDVLYMAAGDMVADEDNEWEEDSDSDDDEEVTDDRMMYLYNNSGCIRLGRGEMYMQGDDEEDEEDEDGEDNGSNAESNDDQQDDASEPEIPDPEPEEQDEGAEDEQNNEEEESDEPFVPTQQHYDLWKIIATLGSRLTALSICRWSKAPLFTKREPIEFWRFGGMVKEQEYRHLAYSSNEFLARGRKEKVNQPRYPTRVINTETLEFETDPVVFKSRYAILSHVWEKDELTFQTVSKLFAAEKESQIASKIEELDKKITGMKQKITDAREEGIKGPAYFWDMEEKVARFESEKRLLKKELDVLVKVREKEEHSKKLRGGGDLSRQPSRRDGAKGRLNRMTTRRGGTAPALLGVNGGAQAAVKEEKIQTQGEKKLMNAIRMARKLDFTYLWVDTVCINKTDGAELSENISSMGDFYKNAHTCLIYLYDIDKEDRPKNNDGKPSKVTQLGQIKTTKWSERGWTLQECVMSKRAKFFNHHWKLIFDSETERRSKRIEQVCHIPQSLLWHGKKPDVAASLILSLSTTRKTTRPEDRAYSLMGILGIRMPVDYGEGADKAIWRLLEQIIKNNGDVSVFNWSGPYHGNKIPGRSLFPTDFSAYEREVVQKYPFNKPLRAHSEVTLGQSGVHARFEIWEPQIIFEDDNELSYKTIRDLDYLLDTPGRETQARLDCEVTCRCVVDGTPENDIYITAYCPRWMLREQLEVQLGIADRSHANSSWCLVRFAGVKGARWFLCQLNYGHSELNKKALFANMFGGVVKDAEVMDDNLRMVLQSKGADRFVHYLEGMGFEGVRIPTMGFEDMQEKVPVERARVLNLWVG